MHVAILGNGVTGVTAAMRLRELDSTCQITVISGESTYHYSRPALMYVFMGHMAYKDTKPFEDHVWKEQRIDLVRDWVTNIDPDQKTLTLHKGQPLQFDKLVIATGSKSNKFGWPGQDLPGVQGLYDLMDLKQLYRNTENCKHAVIVGGGLIGIEMAEMLLSRGITVTFLVREDSYWNNVLPREESQMINELARHHHIDLRLQAELEEIHAGADGRVSHITTKDGTKIDCQLVGLTAGVSPNVDLVKGTNIETGRGVLVDDQLRTSCKDIYAAGDCAEIKRPEGQRNVMQQVWYTGKFQGKHVAESICGSDAVYESGIWFNSAKFFDLEYQTYGKVNMRVEDEENLFWRHPTEMIAFRIVHVAGKVVGFNMMGTRYRHEVCERWLRDERDLTYVLEHLSEAAFDPEFFAQHEPMIREAFAASAASAAGGAQ